VPGERVVPQGHWDARGTLGVDREASIGLTDIALTFELDTDAYAATVQRVVEMSERFCVIYQTLRVPPRLSVTHRTATENIQSRSSPKPCVQGRCEGGCLQPLGFTVWPSKARGTEGSSPAPSSGESANRRSLARSGSLQSTLPARAPSWARCPLSGFAGAISAPWLLWRRAVKQAA